MSKSLKQAKEDLRAEQEKLKKKLEENARLLKKLEKEERVKKGNRVTKDDSPAVRTQKQDFETFAFGQTNDLYTYEELDKMKLSSKEKQIYNDWVNKLVKSNTLLKDGNLINKQMVKRNNQYTLINIEKFTDRQNKLLQKAEKEALKRITKLNLKKHKKTIEQGNIGQINENVYEAEPNKHFNTMELKLRDSKYDLVLTPLTMCDAIYNEIKSNQPNEKIYVSINAILTTYAYDIDSHEQKGRYREQTLQTKGMDNANFGKVFYRGMHQLRQNIYNWLLRLFLDLNVEIQKWTMRSDGYVIIDSISRPRILLKTVKGGAGGKIIMFDGYEDILYNPDVQTNCFVDCMNKSEHPLKKEFVVADIYKRLNKQRQTGIITSRDITNINDMFDLQGKKIKVWSLKNGQLIRPNKYPKYGKNEGYVNLFITLGHYFLINDLKKFKTLDFVNGFKVEEEEVIDEGLPKLALQKNMTVKEQKKDPERLFGNNIWTWDCETLARSIERSEENDKIKEKLQCYAIGFLKIKDICCKKLDVYCEVPKMEKVKLLEGENCLDEFVDFLKTLNESMKKQHDGEIEAYLEKNPDATEAQINYRKYITKNKYKQLFIAHNSGRFDTYLLLSSKIEGLEHSNIVVLNGGILTVSPFEYIEMRDSYRYLPFALRKLCKDFSLPNEYNKGYFPHKFMTSFDSYNYKGIVNEEYWDDEIKDVKEVYPKLVIDIKKDSRRYLSLDCMSLALIWLRFSESIFKLTERNTTDYLTLPSLVFNYAIQEIRKTNDLYIPVGEEARKMDVFFRKAIRGGRCFPQKRFSESYQYSVMEGFNDKTFEEKDKNI